MVLDWLDISPQPCVYEPSMDGPFITLPDLTLIGHSNWAGSPTPLDVYGSLSANLWLFMGNTPLGLINPEIINLPKAPLPLKFTAGVPPNTVFQIPPLCFPIIANSSMGFMQKRMELAVPTFPVMFTMYIVAPALRSAEIIYYVDFSRQYFRIDYPGYSIIQRDGIRYTFLTEKFLSPAVCYNTTAVDLLIKLPTFSRRVANATIEGIQTGIWLGVSDTQSIPVFNEYWYWDPLTNIPVFFVDRNYLGARITLFETWIKNPDTFNQMPTLCLGVPFSLENDYSSKLSLRKQFTRNF